jgi:hypothetical protein
MSIANNNALALIGWHDIRLWLSDLTGGGAVWLLILVFLAFVVISVLAMDAALVLHAQHSFRSRARWPADLSESTIRESTGKVNSDGPGART